MSEATATGSETRHVRSMCRLCTASCGILVTVEGDEVVHVSGDPDHPLSRGYCCSKGRSLPQVHHDPLRLDHPEVDGRRTEWEHAVSDLADRLRGIIETHGPHAVAIYRSFGWATDCNGRFALEKLIRAIGTRSVYSSLTIDLPSKHHVPHFVTGVSYLAPLVDWRRADLVLFLGTNPVVSHGHLGSMTSPRVRLRDLRERGGRIIVADPRHTETARLADLHLPVRPGTDWVLLAHLVREVLARRPDEQYLAETADPDSVDRLRTAVAPYDLETASALCGVPTASLEAARDLVTSTPRLCIQSGTGLSMGASANVVEWLGWALGAVTGSLDRPGGAYFNPGMLRPLEGGVPVGPRVTGPPPATRPDLAHSFGELPCSALADEILGGEVKALLVVGGNPVRVFPETDKIKAALDGLDVLALFDIRRHETADFATHLLPVADQFERADMPAFYDTVYPVPFMQYLPQVVEPAAERRGMWRVMAELGEAMGTPLGVNPEDPDDTLLARAASRSRVPFEQLREAPVGVVGEDVPDPGWLIPGLLPQRLDLAPAELLDQLAAADEAARSSVAGEHLVLINRRLPRQVNSMLQDFPSQLRPPGPTLLIHPDDAAAAGLRSGDRAVVASAHGETLASVEVADTIRPGVVSVPHAWGDPDVNRLTSDTSGVDSMTGMPLFTGIPVTVRPAEVHESAPTGT